MTGQVPHWLKYVRWDVITRWRARAKAAEGSLRYPYAFGSGEKAFSNIKGGVLWLMSAPRYANYRQPPTIIARLEVTDVVTPDDPKAEHVDEEVKAFGPSIAIAAEQPDAYLPLNNASQLLEKLRFDSRVTRLPVPKLSAATLAERPYDHIPRHFQMHRVIAPESIHQLETFAAAVRSGRRVFVSYRWRDFTDAWVGELATALTEHTVSCWLDRRNMPQVSGYENKLLGDILGDAIRQSLWLVALVREGYVADAPPGAPDWVRHEWTVAGHDDRTTRVAVFFGTPPAAPGWLDPARDKVLVVAPEPTPSAVAEKLLALLPPS